MSTSCNQQKKKNRRLKRVAVLVALCLFCLPGISASVDATRFSSYIEKHANGWIDWDKGLIYGVGLGYMSKNKNSKPRAQGAANLLASASIVKLAAGVHLDDSQTLETIGGGRVTIHLKAFLKDKQIQSTFVDNVPDPYFEVINVAYMKGVSGLTAKLLDHLGTEPSWRDFPIRPLKPRAELDDSDQPWLIIDARGMANNEQVQPSMFPKIKSESGETVYELSQVEEAALFNRGMMRYVVSDEPSSSLRSDDRLIDRLLADAGVLFGVREANAKTVERSLSEISIPGFTPAPAQTPAPEAAPKPKRRKRRGKYMVVDASQVEGLAKTNLVVSAQDAMELKEEDAASQILKKCRVVVIASSPIGGIEGKIPKRLAMLNTNQ